MWLWSHHLLFWRKVANASEDPIRLLGHKSTLMAHGQPLIHQDLVVLLCKAPFQQVSPKPILMNVAIPPQIYNSTLAFVEHYTFFSAQLSSLSRSCWMPTQPNSWECILSLHPACWRRLDPVPTLGNIPSYKPSTSPCTAGFINSSDIASKFFCVLLCNWRKYPGGMNLPH